MRQLLELFSVQVRKGSGLVMIQGEVGVEVGIGVRGVGMGIGVRGWVMSSIEIVLISVRVVVQDRRECGRDS